METWGVTRTPCQRAGMQPLTDFTINHGLKRHGFVIGKAQPATQSVSVIYSQ